jgi:hypothetical protein
MLKIEPESNKLVVTLDKYSRILLSVIAVCLVLIVTNLYFSPGTLHAYDQAQDVNIKYIGGSSVYGELPVDMKKITSGNEIKVNITSINGRQVWGDKFPVDIQAINGQFIIGGNLPVTVK